MGEGERYEEFAPPQALRPFVRLLWTYAAPAPTGGVQRIAGHRLHRQHRRGVVRVQLEQGQDRVEQLRDRHAVRAHAVARGEGLGREMRVAEHELVAMPHAVEQGEEFGTETGGDAFEHGRFRVSAMP